jgi:hypothetical protein
VGSGRTLKPWSRSTELVRTTVWAWTMVRKAHVMRRRGSRTVRGANARVVLGAAPAEANARVADGVTLHLVDGHLGGVAVDELHETAALARGNLHIGDFAKALEEGSELVLGHVARKATHKDGGVVGVGELVHLRRRVEAAVREALHLAPHLLLGHATASHHGAIAAVGASVATEALVAASCNDSSQSYRGPIDQSTREGGVINIPVLGRGSGDSHGTVAAVDTLHLDESALLIVLVRETDETVAAALAGHGIRHDLSRLAGGEAGLEERNQDVFVDLGTKVADKDAVLGTTVVAAVDETTARGPVKLELASAVGNRGTVQGQGLGGGIGRGEFDEAVSGVSRVLVANDLDVNSLSGGRKEDALDEVLVHPRLELTHPESGLGGVGAASLRRGDRHVLSGGGSVGERHLANGLGAEIGCEED